MLDTHGRKYVNPIINKTSQLLLKLNLNANHVTFIAFLIGISSGFFIYYSKNIMSVILLWLSGYLDAVDGAMARKSNSPTPWGTLMDITFDRIVEMSVIIGLSLRYPNIRFNLLILMCSILLSMTVFLTVGALSEKKGIKSFYYQAGIAERTEGFILFTLMILLNSYIGIITYIYATIVIITAVQRMIEAKRLL